MRTTSTYSGIVTQVELAVLPGAVFRTRLLPGQSYTDFFKTKLLVSFTGDNEKDYWLFAPQVNIPPPPAKSPDTPWLTAGTQDNPPTPKIQVGARIEISASIKKENTKHGTQLYYATFSTRRSAATKPPQAAADSASSASTLHPTLDLFSRLVALETQNEILEARMAALEDAYAGTL